MKQYIMMLDNSKVSVGNVIGGHIVLCGSLMHIDNFEPILYKRNIRNRFKAYSYGLEMVQVNTETFVPEKLPKNVYAWLISECDGNVYKVWGEGTTGNNVKNFVNTVGGSKVVRTVHGAYLPCELKVFNF